MRQLAVLLALIACCALPASPQAVAQSVAPSSSQPFQLDAAHRQALIKLRNVPNADAGAAHLVVSLSDIEAPPGVFGYIRLTALCEGNREAWHAAISAYPPAQPGRFLHVLRDSGAAACTPDRLMLELVVQTRAENATLLSIRGYVAVE